MAIRVKCTWGLSIRVKKSTFFLTSENEKEMGAINNYDLYEYQPQLNTQINFLWRFVKCTWGLSKCTFFLTSENEKEMGVKQYRNRRQQ